jgi:hypothetical protein
VDLLSYLVAKAESAKSAKSKSANQTTACSGEGRSPSRPGCQQQAESEQSLQHGRIQHPHSRPVPGSASASPKQKINPIKDCSLQHQTRNQHDNYAPCNFKRGAATLAFTD